jgi:hypothetical protein
MHQIISWGESSCRIKIPTTIAFYLKKLNAAQKQYLTTEGDRKLLLAIEFCKEYRNIMLGYYSITVFTDHKNNTFNELKAIILDLYLALVFPP